MSEQSIDFRVNSLCPPIFVTGSPRSGVSMTAGVLRRCGAWVGIVDQSYENTEIRAQTVHPYLRFAKIDPMCQNPIPFSVDNLPPLSGLVRRIETAVKFQGYRSGPWLYKSSALALTWPIWEAAFPEAVWILVRRSDEDVINSCMKTGFMSGYRLQSEWQEWLDAYKRRFTEIVRRGIRCEEVWPQKAVNGDFTELKKVVDWLGLKWNETKVKEWIKPQLWRDCDGL